MSRLIDIFNAFKIEEKSIMMQQARSNNKVLEHLMQKKIKGEIPGVLGRLVRIQFQQSIIYILNFQVYIF